MLVRQGHHLSERARTRIVAIWVFALLNRSFEQGLVAFSILSISSIESDIASQINTSTDILFQSILNSM